MEKQESTRGKTRGEKGEREKELTDPRARVGLPSHMPGLKTGRCLKIGPSHLSHPLLTVFMFGIYKIDVK
jgi:hypothetical protein